MSLQVFILSLVLALILLDQGKGLECHRDFPSEGGEWLGFPPYWIPKCTNNHIHVYDKPSTIECLRKRTVYAIGNSIARQALFGMLEMVGGASISRQEQKELCPSSPSFKWEDKCDQEYSGVKFKFLYLLWMDGFDYSSRGGFPFLKNQTLPSHLYSNATSIGVEETVSLKDNCPFNESIKHCLQNFFSNQPTEDDILILNVGLAYAVNDHPWIDTVSWAYHSAVAFRDNIEELFPGKIFRISNAPLIKDNSFLTPIVHRIDHEALRPAFALDGNWTKRKEDWYTIDQWPINSGRTNLYIDRVHYPGPLTSATLHQIYHLLCPKKGFEADEFRLIHDRVLTVTRPDLSHNVSEKQYYIFDHEYHLHQIMPQCLSLIPSKALIYVNESIFEQFPLQEEFPITICQKKARMVSAHNLYVIDDWMTEKILIGNYEVIKAMQATYIGEGEVITVARWASDLIRTKEIKSSSHQSIHDLLNDLPDSTVKPGKKANHVPTSTASSSISQFRAHSAKERHHGSET